MTPVASVRKFERFFRVAASLDVDKSNLACYSDFVERTRERPFQVFDLLV